jgi:dipeptidyl aminopeptidase/acylaminoacyl peptidase
LLLAANEALSAGSLTAGSLYREVSIQRVAVNPAGTLVAASANHEGAYGILVQVVEDGFKAPVFLSKYPIRFFWADDDTLLVHVSGTVNDERLVIDLKPHEWNLAPEEHPVSARGWVVDSLPLVENEVLWAARTSDEGSIYRAPMSELRKPSGPRDRLRGGRMLNQKYLLATIPDPVTAWVSDRNGIPRAAMVVENDDPLRFELRYRDDPDSRWRTIGSWEAEEAPTLAGIARNDRDLLVLSDEGRQTVALREYRVGEERLGALLYANSRFDLVGVLWDYQGFEVIAAVYEEGGLLRYHHLDVEESQQQRWIQARFPDTNVILTSRTANRRFATAFVTGPRDPGTHYFVDADEQKLIAVGEAMPWLRGAPLVDVEAFEVETDDGLSIEAFLALPQTSRGKRPPLLVMPHGGPIGVRDTRGFNPDVQYFAGSGFAVLQVNYRGSAGRGSSFLEAGKNAWGTEIEDDIETVIDHLVDQGRIDEDRICIFGGSYGGYSALISTTRRPQRYQCAASYAAPTDLLLLFDSSDFAQDEESVARIAEIIGDPDRDRDELIRKSPAYRAAEMNVPILLIHGQDDRRVDVEHVHRMRAMLELHQKSYEWMLLDETEHSPTNKQWARVVVRVARFLREHLGRSHEPRIERGASVRPAID